MRLNPFLLITAIAAVSNALAQPLTSPEVHPDGHVTFRLRAPDAKDVSVHCEGSKVSKMTKDDSGVWSVSTEPLEPDIYVYSFNVDGLRVIDLSNPLIKYNLLNTDSQVRVPGPSTLPWEINDVPHGEIHRHFYKSAVGGDQRDFMVYTPPGYDPSAKKRYPVLYLLHGYSDDTSAWTAVGCANVILDNLIARHEAKPMVIVMPLGYGTMDVIRAGWQGTRRRDLWEENYAKFRQTLLDEVMPQVEKAYRLSNKPGDHAIAGLSMGGSESLLVGLNTLDRFGWVGAFSSGGLSTNLPAKFPKLDASANRQLNLLWVACGKEDGLFTNNEAFHQWLDSKGVKHTWVASPGQHSFRVWRRYLAQFAPLLFQPAK
jgi:enterochelin esterase family protein